MADKKLCEWKYCTGCSACLNICKHNAISMAINQYGFAYPLIDESKCMDCGLCTKACPMTKQPLFRIPTSTFACYGNNDELRVKSSSGGFATILARSVVKENGVVYGCAFIPPMSFAHVRCSTIDDVENLRGSKYVQSNMMHVYDKIKQDIKDHKKILFFGTACQIAGVKSLFGRYDQIFFVDLICHGVPSLQFLCDSLPNEIIVEQKTNVVFRNNTRYHFSVIDGDNTIYERPIEKDLFFKGFFTGVLFRESCFSCRFARKERISDITIGDFWKLKSDIIKNPEKGVSLVLVNSDKGTELFNQVKEEITIEQRSLAEAVAGNEQLNHPFKRGWREKVFKKLYPQMGFKVALWITMPDRLAGTMMKSFIKKYI